MGHGTSTAIHPLTVCDADLNPEHDGINRRIEIQLGDVTDSPGEDKIRGQLEGRGRDARDRAHAAGAPVRGVGGRVELSSSRQGTFLRIGKTPSSYMYLLYTKLSVALVAQSVQRLPDTRLLRGSQGLAAGFAPLRPRVVGAFPRCAMLGAEVITEGRAEQSTPADAKTVFEALHAAGVDEGTACDATYAIQDLGGWAAREAPARCRNDVETGQCEQGLKFESLWTDFFANFESFHTEFIATLKGLRTDINTIAREVRHLG